MRVMTITAAAFAGIATFGSLPAAQAQNRTLRIAIQEDADVLDPARGTTYGGRVVFTALCDKLVDISPKLEIVPMLALKWEWAPDNKSLTFTLRDGVRFHDGTPVDAEAVKYNIDRARTMPESTRKAELASVASVDVLEPLKVRLNLSEPNLPLLVNLSDRAGMIVSPKAAKELGTNFGTAPVCSGPFSFLRRQQRDFIEVAKFQDYWNKDAIFYDRVIYTYIEDSTVRLSRLRAGDIDVAERVAATDIPTIRQDPSLVLHSVPGVGTTHLQLGLRKTPFTTDKRIREAFELAIDRNIINQVAHAGQYVPDNQLIPTLSPFHIKELPVSARNVAKAKEILKQVSDAPIPVEITFANTVTDTRVGQILQSLAREAGFNVKLLPLEGATAIDRYIKGDNEVYIGTWSGRSDPDANAYGILGCKGFQNWGKYCNETVETFLLQARAESDFQKRYDLYRQAMLIVADERPTIPLYHPQWLFGARRSVQGLQLYPDGLLRLVGVKPAS